MMESSSTSPGRVSTLPQEVKDRARMWVIERHTSDGKGLYDSWFTIHAQEAIRWMAEFATAELATLLQTYAQHKPPCQGSGLSENVIVQCTCGLADHVRQLQDLIRTDK